MRGVKNCQTRAQKVGLHTRMVPNPETTYCYCDAWNLTWPHYRAEHTDDHDRAAELRCDRAKGQA